MKIIQLAIRTLLRFRLYTLINILGLALSLACVIVICRYIDREVNTDHFVKDSDRVCYTALDRISNRKPFISGGFDVSDVSDPTNNPAVAIKSSFIPLDDDNLIKYNNKSFRANVLATDTNYLKIMTYPVLQAAHYPLLAKPDEAVITRPFAEKLFGKKDPIGQVLVHADHFNVTITGVLDEPDTQVSYPFDLLLSDRLQKDWSRINMLLVKLHPGTTISSLNKEFDYYTQADSWGSKMRIQLYPVEQFYFDRQIDCFYSNCQKGDFTHVIIFSVVAILLLIIGIFNFINIYTVLMLKRSREFGMKKVFGANVKQVALQLYLENLFMTSFALFFAWILIELASGIVQTMLAVPIVTNIRFSIKLTVTILLLLPLLASVYPFIRFNFTKPITSLQTVGRGGNPTLSRTLFLSVQYIITIILIVVSLFFVKQLHFMLDADLGYRTEHILKTQLMNMPAYRDDEVYEKYLKNSLIVKERLADDPLFNEHTFSDSPVSISDFKVPMRTHGHEEYQNVTIMSSTEDFFKLFDIQLKEGRLWNDSIDSDLNFNVIINETAQKLLNLTDLSTAEIQPERHFVFSEGMDFAKVPFYKVVGVVKDFNTGHLSKAVPPIIFYFSPGSPMDNLFVHIPNGREQDVISSLQQIYEDLNGTGFSYSFLTDELRKLYNKDRQISTIYSIFACIAILISSLGLFSLSLFDVQQRYREIAIRKVNGATTSVIMKMLLRKYYKLLTIAFCISVPIAWLALHRYLEGFAHKAPISWWLFVIALLITGGISLATLIWQIQKAARTNPADAIKSE